MADKPDIKSVPEENGSETSVLIIQTMISTTWRMFVPSVGLMTAGLLLDQIYNTTPWLLLTGFVIGLALSTALVARQIRKLKPKGELK